MDLLTHDHGADLAEIKKQIEESGRLPEPIVFTWFGFVPDHVVREKRARPDAPIIVDYPSRL